MRQDRRPGLAGVPLEVDEDVDLVGMDALRCGPVGHRGEVDEVLDLGADAGPVLGTILDAVRVGEHLEARLVVPLEHAQHQMGGRVVVEVGGDVSHPDARVCAGPGMRIEWRDVARHMGCEAPRDRELLRLVDVTRVGRERKRQGGICRGVGTRGRRFEKLAAEDVHATPIAYLLPQGKCIHVGARIGRVIRDRGLQAGERLVDLVDAGEGRAEVHFEGAFLQAQRLGFAQRGDRLSVLLDAEPIEPEVELDEGIVWLEAIESLVQDRECPVVALAFEDHPAFHQEGNVVEAARQLGLEEGEGLGHATGIPEGAQTQGEEVDVVGLERDEVRAGGEG